jgi:plastocyanin
VRRLATSVGLLVASLLGVGASVTPAAAEQSYGASVSMIDNAFTQQIVRIEPGTTIEWVNDGRSLHNVTADGGTFASANLASGEEFTSTFSSPGVFAYHCTLHGTAGAGMIGTVVVGDVPLPGPTGDVTPGREPVPGGFADTIRVPRDQPTIQDAVDHASPGGLVLISPGIYEEAVTVTVPYLTIRGMDRNRTIIDGGFTRANGIQVIEADGVSIENLTSRNNLLNGFYWNRVHGFRGSYLTASNNGDYGIYAYASDYGQFDHSTASGSPDSGFYIGECDPCHALITDVLAEHNAMGFSGTNASGDLAIVNSEWRDNMAGIVPNTLDSERLPPQRDILIAGNYVHDNNSTTVDTKRLEYPTFGMGIIITGGQDNRVVGNLVEDQRSYGIAVLPNLDTNLWVTSGNQILDNVVRRTGRGDLALGAPSAGGDCFAGNDASTSTPPAIELLFPCEGLRPFPGGGGSMAPTLTALTRFLRALDGNFPHGSWRNQPLPGAQAQMPGDPAVAPQVLAIPGETVPLTYRIRTVADIASAPGDDVSKELTIMGMPLATSWGGLLLGLYGYILPFVLYASWVAIAMWDLIRQESASIPHRARWMLIVLVVPFLGPLLYFAFGGSPIPRQLRLILTAGGIVVYLVFVAIGALVGG